ncbi:alanine racemase [Acinetobacter sp. YH16032]|uniref:alanine racemase n=1 Tax=Acinetobacter sp. YH16032 TaxID=2601181 RepID=UPI0015D3DF64|nr:alanine racemase [Acinetobacter sp. YH16032]
MSRPIQAVIHLNAIKHNLKVAKQHVPNAQVFAVVKANAYGHGIERIYSALVDADGIALLELSEAQRVRDLGWKGPILLLEGIFQEADLQLCHDLDLQFTVHNEIQVEWIKRFSLDAHFNIFLKMNSGMNRLGFQPQRYPEIWSLLTELPQVASITHMTHFSDADGERLNKVGVDYQISVFNQIISVLGGPCSLSNSAAILRHANHVHSNIVRSGIMLYGSSPDYPTHTIQDWDLKPTMSLRSELIAIQEINPQQSIGYGSTFFAEQAMKIGIVACGYADGYQRITQSDTTVLVNGQKTSLIGRVSMDMLAVDITHIEDAKIGSEVVLWGVSKYGSLLPIDEVAAGASTVGYELMCGVTTRVPFVLEI